MFGILVLIAVYFCLGFLLSWIAGVVAREEVSIGTSVVTIVIAGLLSFGAGLGLREIAPDAAPIVEPVADFVIFTLMIHLIAKLSLKHSAIIAAIYAVILLLFGLAMRGCVALAA